MRVAPNILLLLLAMCCAVQSVSAEDGYDLWLRYRRIGNPWLDRYRVNVKSLVGPATTPTLRIAQDELSRGLTGLLAAPVGVTDDVAPGAVVFGTPKSSALIASQQLDLRTVGDEGYVIRAVSIRGQRAIAIAANTDIGVLYGAFHFLRLLQTRQSLDAIDLASAPRVQHRVLNHWDNLDGSVERGYAGASIWDWHKLPDYIDPRYIDYARANASLGINGTVLTNVNAKAISLTPLYLKKAAALADVLRPYGIRVFLTARFSAPMEIGDLKTADPLDPQVREWWRAKADEIQRYIADFGGFLVKANSEGQPGPQDYGRSHADGANMLADAVAPHGGIVMWRAFVYSNEQPDDRAKQAYSEFVPLDAKFRDNVLLQVKNGAIDFQPREPFHPLFGAMPRTPLMMEFQITREYLGFATHLAYLGPLYEEVLSADTYAQGKGSTVARVVDGSLHRYAHTGMAGVANIGSDRNWCGSQFDQANWYAFGRLAWDPSASSKAIAEDWTRMTFSADPAFVAPVVDMMMSSREAVVDYMTPLGLHHLMARGHHYGPGPWETGGRRADWTPVYYHRADERGIGFDRTASGSNAVAQYRAPVAAQFADPRRTPEKFLLWFHHLPWDYRTASGRSLWDELVYRYTQGVTSVGAMRKTWERVASSIDTERSAQIAAFLQIQQQEAKWWRDASVAYFQTLAGRPLPQGLAPPEHTLDYYQSLSFPYAPGDPGGDRSVPATARPIMHALFQDHVVLQRDRPITIWGTAQADVEITVALGGASASAKADSAGRWTATLPAMQAGGPYSLTARTNTNVVQKVDDVLIGDVWLCSGQSNMALQVHRSLNSRAEIAGSASDSIRMLTVGLSTSFTPLENFTAPVQWLKAAPATVPEFSAACFYFARELQKTVAVPLGLITAAWGGSRIETWTSEKTLQATGKYEVALDVLDRYRKDPAEANRRWGSLWETWWRDHAGTRRGEEPWNVAETGQWHDAPAKLGAWEEWGVPELAKFNGMVWYRTRLTLTAKQAAQSAVLSLGAIDEVDETWVNGVPVGYTSGADVQRRYPLPRGALKAGENVIVVNALDTYAAGGMTGPANKLQLRLADGTSVPLGQSWRYQIAPSNLGPPPRAPWEPLAGLGVIRNAMIAPLGSFQIRGVTWYQGEANTEQASLYEKQLHTFMADWRQQFGAGLPFLIVQLANYGPVSTWPVESDWAELREAQRLAVSKDAYAGLAVTIDIGDPYDLHPPNKQEVGRRLALAARRVVYGEKIPLGPVPRSTRRSGGNVEVIFGDVTEKLVVYGANNPTGFELCGDAPGSCRYAAADVHESSVILTSPDDRPVTRVRYCWADSPVCTLFDQARLPAVPFEMAIH